MGPKKNINNVKPVKLHRKTHAKLERKTPVKLERKTKSNKVTPTLKKQSNKDIILTPEAKTKCKQKITPKLKDLLLTPVAKTKSNKVTPTLKKQSNNDIPTKQYSLRDFNGDDSIFEDGCYKKTLVYCCFCHDVVLSIPLFCKKCEGQLNLMCETCSNTHICRVDNLEKSYCSNSPFQW